jgi:hypothetical protein
MKPIVLWQSPQAKGRAAEDTRAQAEIANELGCTVVELPEHLDDPGQVEAILHEVPREPEERAGVWVGFFPTPVVYDAVYEALEVRNIRLVNGPGQHLAALEMERSTPLLGELTPKTAVIHARDLDDDALDQALDDAVKTVGGYPVFLKGAIKSRKEDGWDKCVAEDAEALRVNARLALKLPEVIARGQVVVRALAPLKRKEVGDRDFLVAKEFRVFLYNAEVLAWAFYWPYLLEEFWPLPREEEQAMLKVARDAAGRLPTPYVTVDVAQQEDDTWIAVEPSDAQFSGLNLVDPRALWRELAPKLSRADP